MTVPTLTIEAVPAFNSACPGEMAIRLNAGEFRPTCTVRPVAGSDQPEPARRAAILADLLRPGWDACARPLTPPVLRDGVLYRGFRLVRSSRIDGREWEAVMVVPADAGKSFDWGAFTALLTDIHRAICSSDPDAD